MSWWAAFSGWNKHEDRRAWKRHTALKFKNRTRALNLLLVVQYRGPYHDKRTGKTPANSLLTYASINSSGAHPPRATAGHLLTLSVPGVGHSQFYRGPGGWALAYPGATPGHLTYVFLKDRWVYREGRGLCQRLTLKICFVKFRYFFVTCKHVNISDKVNYILFITKQSLTWTLREHDYFAFRIQN